MHSLKPGRGPSLMRGLGGLIAIVGGIIWTVAASSMGAPGVFVLFGIVFILAAVATTVYSFWAATTRNRPSTFDITRGDEEYDPIARALGHEPKVDGPSMDDGESKPRRFEGEYCPFCGEKVEGEFDFCPHCGKDI